MSLLNKARLCQLLLRLLPYLESTNSKSISSSLNHENWLLETFSEVFIKESRYFHYRMLNNVIKWIAAKRAANGQAEQLYRAY
jgi:hypothetical protein